MGRVSLKNQVGQSFWHPFGNRVFTMDDWIVRVVPHEGKVRLVGVPPELSEEDALKRGVRHTLLLPGQIKTVSIERRRDHMKEQVST
jgi:hypothetical protein